MITIPWALLVLLIAAAMSGPATVLYLRGRGQQIADAVLDRELAHPLHRSAAPRGRQ